MHCPFCSAIDTRVIDSRVIGCGGQVRRRRECMVCQERFTTKEYPELAMPKIIKNDGSRTAYEDEKLRAGILRALEKRPVGDEQVEAVMQRLTHLMRASGERELSSRQIGEWVMDELRELDEVAYVRFASVYRSFQDVQQFSEEIQRMHLREPQVNESKAINETTE